MELPFSKSSGSGPIWSERQRLAFLERVLFWRGWVNRKDLIAKFGISVPQATNDMVAYQTLNPTACLYNTRKRRYEVAPGMKPLLIVPEFGTDMRESGLGDGSEEGKPFVVFPDMPVRAANFDYFRTLSRAAFSEREVRMVYYSVASGKETERWISPRTFANDGLRWHVRAFCHQREDFRDFVLGRIAKVLEIREKTVVVPEDKEWEEQVVLIIKPAPGLDAAARKGIELDYGMSDGELRCPVRRGMEIYFRRRLGFPDRGIGILNDRGQLELNLDFAFKD